MANQNLGNVMTRLGGLKNVSGRRVMPGAEFLQDLEDVDTDVSGTAQPLPNFANFKSPDANLPQPDLGGELSSQSYDVRANSVTPPDEGNDYRRLGAALASQVKKPEPEPQEQGMLGQAWDWFKKGWTPSSPEEIRAMQAQRGMTPPVETQQVEASEGLPPVSAEQQKYQMPQMPKASPGVLGAVKDYFSPTKNAEMETYNTDLNQYAQLKSQGKDPEQVYNETHQNLNQEVEKAMEQPWQHSAYGSASEVANHPALQAKFKEITGTDYEPQIAAQITEHESAMKGVEDALNGVNTQLNEREEGIKQRILSNQATDSDKYFIGLALLMPLLIGGMFGKEAGLGALGGGAQGIADVLGGRQKQIREDEASLLDINKQQGANQEKIANMALEKAKLGPALRKLLPEDPNQHLVGMREIEWQDPATGENTKGIEVKPGLIARPEYMASKEGKMDMLKAANELTQVKTFVKEMDDLTQDVSEIVTQLKDPSKAWKIFTSVLQGKVPGALSAMTEDVMFDGRMQNAGTLLEEKLGFLANAYGMAKEIGQLDRAAQAHIKKIIENPTSTLLTPRDALNQVLEVRKLAQKGLVENASNKGFYPEFIIKDLEARNNPLFGKLNQKDEDRQVAEIEKKLSQNEFNYAK